MVKFGVSAHVYKVLECAILILPSKREQILVLTNHDSSRAGNIFKLREALHSRHGDLVADPNPKSKKHLGTDVHGFRGVNIQDINQGHSGGHDEGAEELVGLCVAGLSYDAAADNGSKGEEGEEWEGVHAACHG